ncbi:hypothetical protein TNIN_161341 [Trichonephila inaurata madagascariensis]|uniref:Uncharacterized protein n=1 Tax=Trichonephila inaurata madagascariensis TaxID=2747483 RepID=A0A8X6YYH8_9ARAC|nr:hypothetical protein TNIN_161341 [Trichonephila inaurata madagascariensis]
MYKMCEGLGIQVQLAPIEKDIWIKKFKKPIKNIPIVRSGTILKFCIALNIPAQLAAGKNIEGDQQQKSLNPIKVPPVVNSVAVYKICQALGAFCTTELKRKNKFQPIMVKPRCI